MKYRASIPATHFGGKILAGARNDEGYVNTPQITPTATGVAPKIEAVGDDTNISLALVAKGTAQVRNTGACVFKTTASTITTAGVAAYTAAQFLGGLILRDPNGAGRADTVPTGAAVCAAIPGYAVGDSFDVIIRNDADAAETITVSTDTGATLSGTMTIAQNNAKRFRLVITGANTYTLYSLGTVVF
jgi:hypothetical protein